MNTNIILAIASLLLTINLVIAGRIHDKNWKLLKRLEGLGHQFQQWLAAQEPSSPQEAAWLDALRTRFQIEFDIPKEALESSFNGFSNQFAAAVWHNNMLANVAYMEPFQTLHRRNAFWVLVPIANICYVCKERALLKAEIALRQGARPEYQV